MESSKDGCKNKNKDRTVVEFRFHHEHGHVSEGGLMAPFARRSLEITATAVACRRSCVEGLEASPNVAKCGAAGPLAILCSQQKSVCNNG
jgi:hypothetical protein